MTLGELLETINMRMDSGLIITLAPAKLVPPLCWKPLQLIDMMSEHPNRLNR